MDADRNLLFGVLALQADLIDRDQFLEACLLWAGRKETAMADLLLERGWIVPDDRAHLNYLMGRKLHKHRGDPRASLAALPDDIKHSLVALGDDDIRRSLAPPSERAAAADPAATVDHVLCPHERYARLRLHATGGIGRVWLARDVDLGRDVALKELRPEQARHATLGARFLQEARITGQLEHPGIIPVYELVHGQGDQQPFYTMRFVKGRTLSEAARAFHQRRTMGQAETLDLPTLLNAFVTACNTLAYAHSRGVLHRDLKGQNVLLGDFGEVIVLDWGLAKLLGRPEGEAAAPSTVLEVVGIDSGYTVHGEALGTPAYMAPEQAAGRLDLIDRRTDVYGLGAILYEILTGAPPFAGDSIKRILRKVCDESPAPPRSFWPEVPPVLEAVCLRALAKEPANRYASATELAHELQQWQEVQRRQAEEDLHRFFALSIDLLCTAGFDGYFKQLNPAWENKLGYSREELLAQPFWHFLHPEDREATEKEMERLSQGGNIALENRYRCKDGSYRWLQWTATTFFGQPPLIYAATRDVTERKQAEEALRASEERYRSVIAAMRDGIVLLDADGSIQSCNAAAERILGLSAEQMMGRTPHDPRWRAIHEDGSPFPGETHPPMVTLRTSQPCTDVVMGVHKPDGTLTWITVNSQPLFQSDNRTLAGVVASFADITERKRTEELLRQTAERLARCEQQLRRRDAVESSGKPRPDTMVD
jgi:PAS domain S-box-containing protein